MKKLIYIIICILAFGGTSITYQSCTNLDEEVFSELSGDKFFDREENLLSAFGIAYTNMYHLVGNKFGFTSFDCGTDLLLVPQRGGDWFDNGQWHRFHRHQWNADEQYFERWWNILFKGVNICNQLIEQFEEVGTDEADIAISELRAFRALYYYWLIDLFGNVPIIDQFDVPADFAPTTNSRSEVYAFIESEIIAVSDQLSKETGLSTYGRVNYYVAQVVLAKLYMNAEVYTGTAQWEKAEQTLNGIINSNAYSLSSDYFDNFLDDAYPSSEIILGVPFDEVNADGFELHLFSLHYNLQEKFGLENLPWNGLCAQESLFNLFEDTDLRLNGLLHGPQVDIDGKPITDPSYEKFDPTNPTGPRDPDGPQVNLTPEVNMLEPNCLRQAGARLVKWLPTSGTARYLSNDFPVFRYADILLLKAEVLLRNGNSGDALTLVNEVRNRAMATPLGTVTMESLLDERARELYAEGHRRNDLIRFGKYNDAGWEKEATDPSCVNIYPIPESQINVNINLKQNPCY